MVDKNKPEPIPSTVIPEAQAIAEKAALQVKQKQNHLDNINLKKQMEEKKQKREE